MRGSVAGPRKAGGRGQKTPAGPQTPALPRAVHGRFWTRPTQTGPEDALRPGAYSVWPFPLSSIARTARAISASANTVSSPRPTFVPSLFMSIGSPSASSLRGSSSLDAPLSRPWCRLVAAYTAAGPPMPFNTKPWQGIPRLILELCAPSSAQPAIPPPPPTATAAPDWSAAIVAVPPSPTMAVEKRWTVCPAPGSKTQALHAPLHACAARSIVREKACRSHAARRTYCWHTTSQSSSIGIMGFPRVGLGFEA